MSSEYSWSDVSDAAVRPVLVVIRLPCLHLLPCILNAQKPMLVQALLAGFSIEACDVAVLLGGVADGGRVDGDGEAFACVFVDDV